MSAAVSLDPPFPDDDDAPPTPAAFDTRFVHLSAEAYFAEPCKVPALSASIANVLDTESPLHAWDRHPRFGATSRAPTRALDNGSLSHAMLLGAGKEIEIIDAADYKTKAAQASRDAARDAGKLPVLVGTYTEALVTSGKLRQRFADIGIVLDGESELAALWTETASNGATVQCRGMFDHMKLPVVYDIKSIRSANPEMCRKHIENYGYAVQRAAYVSAVERIRPDLAGRVDFIFVFYETESPYAVTPIRLDGAFREFGRRGWRRAVDSWERCLRTNTWPSYAGGIIEIEPSPWTLARDMERHPEEQQA